MSSSANAIDWSSAGRLIRYAKRITGMPHSRVVHQKLPCPECKQPIAFEFWQIIDTVERPDLVDGLCDGTLYSIQCKACECKSQLKGPVLVYCPAMKYPLLFSFPESTAEQEAKHCNELVNILRESLGDGWEERWLDR